MDLKNNKTRFVLLCKNNNKRINGLQTASLVFIDAVKKHALQIPVQNYAS